jgi:hypothetical protein
MPEETLLQQMLQDLFSTMTQVRRQILQLDFLESWCSLSAFPHKLLLQLADRRTSSKSSAEITGFRQRYDRKALQDVSSGLQACATRPASLCTLGLTSGQNSDRHAKLESRRSSYREAQIAHFTCRNSNSLCDASAWLPHVRSHVAYSTRDTA